MSRTKTPYSTACATKAGRASLAKAMKTIAEKHGASIGIGGECEPFYKRETSVIIALGPYRVSMGFNGTGCPGAFLGHWHMDYRTAGDTTYPRDFCVTIHGTINTSHWCKATTCEDTWTLFVQSIDDGLGRLAAILATSRLAA